MRIEQKIKTGNITIQELNFLIAANIATSKRIGVEISNKVIGKHLQGRIMRDGTLLSSQLFTFMWMPTKIACMHEWFAVELSIIEKGKTNGIPYGLTTQTLFPESITKINDGNSCWFSCESILQKYPWAMFPKEKIRIFDIFGTPTKMIRAEDIERPGIQL